MSFIYDLVDAWNDAGTTFTGIKLNVTDTASAAGSLLMNLQRNGEPKVTIGKLAEIYAYNTYTNASNYERGFFRWNGNVLEIGMEAAGTGVAGRNVKIQTAGSILKTAGGNSYAIEFGSIRYSSSVILLWSNSINAHTGITSDVGIKRSAAGRLQITNGSTGTGELIFVVPTTDPAISGALWNNAGTLAISAGA